ncbi:MAG TPA: ABC transporter ATP-binding protein [Actinomycetota bacterium]
MGGLAFRDVGKAFGAVTALRGLDVEVAQGELLVLVGPSGCGKTTALRVAAGLERPDEGRLFIGSRDVTDLPPGKRNVAMVFQSYALFPHLTAEENIVFGLRSRGMDREAARERAHSAARLAGCGELLDRKPSQLSGGERQRVALARALAREPEVFLLDEPLSSLDAQLRVEMRAEIAGLHRRLGSTMLYVTHDQVEALMMGDRVGIMREGALEQVGTPDEVYRRPATRFVARFLGSPPMNLLPAVRDGAALRAGPFLVDRPEVAGLSGRLEVGVRPERVRIGDGARAEVRLVETAGSERYVHLWTGELTVIARTAADAAVALGETARVGFDPADACVFDADTGRTLVHAR